MGPSSLCLCQSLLITPNPLCFSVVEWLYGCMVEWLYVEATHETLFTTFDFFITCSFKKISHLRKIGMYFSPVAGMDFFYFKGTAA